MLLALAIGIFGYLCGSIPFGKLISARYGVDIQKRGSGNIGFANVLRVLGWKAAVPVLLLDCIKGFIPAFLAAQLISPSAAFIVGIATIVGHLFPVWLRFKGGKGVATSLGVLLAVTPIVGLIGFITYVIGSAIIKNSSYASICAGLAVLASGMFFFPDYSWAFISLLLIAFWTLRKNLFGSVPNYDI